MANVKITELPSASSITSDDLLVIVDSGNPYVTKKISWKDIDSPQDGITYGRKNNQWVDITSPANLQINRGTATEVAAYIALSGEPVYDTTSKALHIGDGSTAGGSLIGAKSLVSGGGYGTDYSLLQDTYISAASATIGPQSSVWRLSGYQRFDGDQFNSSSPRIRVGTGMADGADILGGYYTATNTNGSVLSGLIRDTGDQVDLTGAVAGVWSIHIDLIVRVLEPTVEVSFSSIATEGSGDLYLTWSLLVAERLT